jgi:hypothetical protein
MMSGGRNQKKTTISRTVVDLKQQSDTFSTEKASGPGRR